MGPSIFMCSLEEHMPGTCRLSYHPLFFLILLIYFIQRSNLLYSMNSGTNFLSWTFLSHVTKKGSAHHSTQEETLTGLGINFYSHCFHNFKLNSIMTLLHRAYSLTSSWQALHEKITYLQQYLINSCYPSKLAL